MIIEEKLIINELNREYPKSKALEWDYVGYSIKNSNSCKIENILVCLDVNKKVIEKAIEKNVKLIISFHPFCFAKTWNEIYKYDPFKKEQVQILKKNKINVFSIHTNYENYIPNRNILSIANLINDFDLYQNSNFYSIIKYKKTFSELVETIKETFKFNNLISNVFDDSKQIKKICLMPGAGNVYDFLKISKKQKVDLLITSDLKWNEMQLLNSENIYFLIVPHLIEQVFVDEISFFLKQKFPKLKIIKYKEKDFLRGL